MTDRQTKVPLCCTGLRPLWGRCPASSYFNSQSCKAGQRVSLTTNCPWATCSSFLSLPAFLSFSSCFPFFPSSISFLLPYLPCFLPPFSPFLPFLPSLLSFFLPSSLPSFILSLLLSFLPFPPFFFPFFSSLKKKVENLTSHPRIIYGQRYLMPCLK